MEIVNRVAESDIEVFDLAALWDGAPVVELDVQPFLYRGLVLREKEFRTHVATLDPETYRDRHVALFCSSDSIIPTWAWMLLATRLEGVARSVSVGREAEVLRDAFVRALERVDWAHYRDRIVVIKGCGSKVVPTNAYLHATQKLMGVARKLMYGEPCSSVPLWRRPKGEIERPEAAAKPVLPPSA